MIRCNRIRWKKEYETAYITKVILFNIFIDMNFIFWSDVHNTTFAAEQLGQDRPIKCSDFGKLRLYVISVCASKIWLF